MSAFPFPPDEAPKAPAAAAPTLVSAWDLMAANRGIVEAGRSLAYVSKGGVDFARLGARIVALAATLPEGPDRAMTTAALERQGQAIIAAGTFLSTLTQLGLAPSIANQG